ncbi:gamma-aminobutyrate dehydratase [Mycobacterium paragordonae]|uniref:4-hydroxyphenylacetate 3-hydroxylase N-terminal domain-containing protein n=1 Tax=Mycobacterium paragordonae TaxID=1389713 RepID=UPI00105CAE89|nr:4-hydroxyphenylacetate 3-hydroxylase N-terminal domain-containing protein [Mycobacterium paragordonae]TDK94321.1 gamma-aminobutyrate dehydratase [Mycobacterium paragordonae]
MGLRTAAQYREGLADNRRVYYQGQLVDSVAAHPELALAVDHSALCYDITADLPDLAVSIVEGQPISAFYTPPASTDDLIRRGRLIEEVSRRGAGTIVLKEVGSDALFALLRTTEGDGRRNAERFYQQVCDGDVALAVAQTDVKGDRSRGPSQQDDPDLYVRITDEDSTSITVRGAKCHTSFSANADELIVLPTRAMGADDAEYAVSFAIPIDTPGLNLYVSPYAAGQRNSFEFPLSSTHKLLESLTVFDDVRVPKNRVFLNRRPELAGPLALAFVDYHRFTAVNYKLPLLDIIVGAAHLIADANGIIKAGHVKTKLSELITWSETVRGLAELSALRSRPAERGVQQPDPLAVNMAKYHFAHGFHHAIATLIDLSGGLLATGPGRQDWDNPAIRAVLEKYYAAAKPAEHRLRLLNFIADLTARDYGGYQAVLATHAEGSLEAEKLQITRSYDPKLAVEFVKQLAGIATQ